MKVLVVSHGPFANSVIESGAMITGLSNIAEGMSLNPNDNIDDFEKKIKKCLDENEGDILILTDILGGSPFNIVYKLYKLSNRNNIAIVSGINMPLYIEILSIISFGEPKKDNVIKELKKIYDSTIKIINWGRLWVLY